MLIGRRYFKVLSSSMTTTRTEDNFLMKNFIKLVCKKFELKLFQFSYENSINESTIYTKNPTVVSCWQMAAAVYKKKRW